MPFVQCDERPVRYLQLVMFHLNKRAGRELSLRISWTAHCWSDMSIVHLVLKRLEHMGQMSTTSVRVFFTENETWNPSSYPQAGHVFTRPFMASCNIFLGITAFLHFDYSRF